MNFGKQGIRIKTQLQNDSNPELIELTNYSFFVQKSQTKTLVFALFVVRTTKAEFALQALDRAQSFQFGFTLLKEMRIFGIVAEAIASLQ